MSTSLLFVDHTSMWARNGRCIGIDACWNAGSTQGMTVSVSGDNLTFLAEVITAGGDRMLVEHIPPKIVLEQLQKFADLPIVNGQRAYREGDTFRILLNISYLKRLKLLPDDDFNGIVYTFEH